MTAEEPPLYPIQLYIFNADGTYGEPIEIVSEGQLMGPGTQFIVRHAVESGREVMMTDPMDLCIFHAKEGRVLFPAAAVMSRFIDIIMERIKDDRDPLIGLGYEPKGYPPLRPEDRERHAQVKDFLKRAAVFEGTNVSDYYWSGSGKDAWEKSDFPGMVPPYPLTWSEHRRPRQILQPGFSEPPERYMPERYAILWMLLDFEFDKFIEITKPYRSDLEPPAENIKWIVIGSLFEGDDQEPFFDTSTKLIAYLNELGDIEQWYLPGCPGKPGDYFLPMDMKHLFFSSMFMLSLLNCKHMKTLEHAAPKALQKARSRRGHLPLRKYTTIEIDVLKSPIPKRGASQPTGGHPAFHITRAHFARYGAEGRGLLFGKIAGLFWIPQHAKGLKSEDSARKDYKIKPLKKEGEDG